MPGVPSFRGCEACHRQKKKCDELQPACSRCARLRIKCEGRGRQRYQFKHSFQKNGPENAATVSPQQQPVKQYRWVAERRLLPKPPSNEVTMAANSFISVLQVNDPRYDVTCYGGFLVELPRRLGTNEALDASMKAMAMSFPAIYSKQLPYQAFDSYGKALAALRTCLMDPKKAAAPETLCAIYMISICQDWIGRKDKQEAAHVLGMVHLLQGAVPMSKLSEFEKAVRRTVGISIILESFGNPRINLEALNEVLADAEGPRALTRPDGSNFPSLELLTLARFPSFFEHPIRNMHHIKIEYSLVQIDTPKMLQKMLELQHVVERFTNDRLPVPAIVIRQLNATQAGYGLMLAMSICFGAIISAYELDERNTEEQLDTLIDKVVVFSQVVSTNRPLGSSYMSLPLVAAAAATNDEYKKAKLESIMDGYLSDFPETICMDKGRQLQGLLERIRVIRRQQLKFAPEVCAVSVVAK